jgi:hypothetical protein
VHTSNLITQTLRQEDHEFKARLGYLTKVMSKKKEERKETFMGGGSASGI